MKRTFVRYVGWLLWLSLFGCLLSACPARSIDIRLWEPTMGSIEQMPCMIRYIGGQVELKAEVSSGCTTKGNLHVWVKDGSTGEPIAIDIDRSDIPAGLNMHKQTDLSLRLMKTRQISKHLRVELYATCLDESPISGRSTCILEITR